MSDTAELERITAEAEAEEAQAAPEAAAPGEAGSVAPSLSVEDEFAEFLTFAAKMAGVVTQINVEARFHPEANRQIAGAAVALCQRYGKDPRALLIGTDSALGAWLGLALAIGLPGVGLYQDWKAARAKEVKAAEGGDDGSQASQQPRQ